MKCRGTFINRGLIKRDGGEFTNSEGKEIKYKESYILKVDDETESGIYERNFRIAADSPLIPQLKALKLYENITLEFDIRIYRNNVSIIPIALVK